MSGQHRLPLHYISYFAAGISYSPPASAISLWRRLPSPSICYLAPNICYFATDNCYLTPAFATSLLASSTLLPASATLPSASATLPPASTTIGYLTIDIVSRCQHQLPNHWHQLPCRWYRLPHHQEWDIFMFDIRFCTASSTNSYSASVCVPSAMISNDGIGQLVCMLCNQTA